MVTDPQRVPFGPRLKRERESRGISLDDVSIATKISLRMLRALEEENFSQLPGGIFNKGFVRAYARHLGIDEERTIADYLEAVGESTPAQTLEPAPEKFSPPPKPPKQPHAAEVPWGLLAVILLAAALALSLWSYHTRENSTAQMPAPASTQPTPAQTATPEAAPSQSAPVESTATQPAAPPTGSEAAPKQATPSPATPPPVSPPAVRAQAEASQADSAASRPANPPPSDGSKPHPSSTAPEPRLAPTQTPPAQSAPTPAQSAPTLSTTAPPASSVGNTVKNSSLLAADSKAANPPKSASAPATSFVLLIEAEENSWVSITADGKTVLDGTLIAPAVKSVRAEKQIVVKAGNVGALSFSVNGKKLPPQGEAGEVRTLTFSPNGLEIPASKPPS